MSISRHPYLADTVKIAVDGVNDVDIEVFRAEWRRAFDMDRLVSIGGGDGEPMWFSVYTGPMPNPYSPFPSPDEGENAHAER